MATSSKVYQIFQGAAVAAATTLQLISTGSGGTRGAARRLVHPDSQIATVSYFSNPDRTFNLDNDVLFAPRVQTILTEGTTRVVRRETALEDVIITEIWTAEEGRKLSMPTSFLRQLYEYLLNPPVVAPSQTYIQWEPRDRTDDVYNVELVRLAVGGGFENNQLFDVADLKQGGGKFDGGSIKGPLDDLNPLETGVVDRTVVLTMRIVSKV